RRQRVEPQQGIRCVAFLQFPDQCYCSGSIANSSQCKGCCRLYIPPRTQRQSRRDALLRRCSVAQLRLAHRGIYLPRSRLLFGLCAKGRVHCPARKVPRLAQPSVVGLSIGLGREQPAFVSGLARTPSHLPFHLSGIPPEKREKVHTHAQTSAVQFVCQCLIECSLGCIQPVQADVGKSQICIPEHVVRLK